MTSKGMMIDTNSTVRRTSFNVEIDGVPALVILEQLHNHGRLIVGCRDRTVDEGVVLPLLEKMRGNIVFPVTSFSVSKEERKIVIWFTCASPRGAQAQSHEESE